MKPGEKFFVVVDDIQYEVIAPEGCVSGEMIAMDIMPDLRPWESIEKQRPTPEVPGCPDLGHAGGLSKGDLEYEASVVDSVATDASIVQITVPDNCHPGDTFITVVNGLEFEILVPKGSNTGDVITMEVPSKRAIGKFALPGALANAPSILASQSSSDTGIFVEVSVPENVLPGQTFVAAIDNMEFDVPVPATRCGNRFEARHSDVIVIFHSFMFKDV